MKRTDESIICAGFGGQGIMMLGKVLASAGMEQDFFVTWLPSYGAEVRGGTAHSMVRISSEPVASPVVHIANTGVIMNAPSLDKFESRIRPGGLLIVNSSLIPRRVMRNDIDVIEAPLTDEAIKIGNIRVANMIAAGIHVARKKILEKKTVAGAIERMVSGRKELIPVNIKALEKGMEIAGEVSI